MSLQPKAQAQTRGRQAFSSRFEQPDETLQRYEVVLISPAGRIRLPSIERAEIDPGVGYGTEDAVQCVCTDLG